jgi:general secretion pathway protein A
MYERYYGLKEKPFSLTPDPEFLYVNKQFQAAFDNILYGIKRHEGFTTIVGDVGTGKTTLCWSLLGKLKKDVRTALILNPLLTEEDMLKAILQDFGVKARWNAPAPEVPPNPELPYDPTWMQGLTRKELIDALNYFLLDGAAKNIFSILIIDESQNLSLGVLEQLRILSNLETSKKKLLQIIFVGQLEFEDKLRLPQLRQLNQRITIRYVLKPLSNQDTLQYIEHRLAIAGSQRSVLFTKGALRRICRFSKGYPRLINIICDRTLLAGYNARTRIICGRNVKAAALGLLGGERPPRTRFFRSGKVWVPVMVLLAIAMAAAIYLWVMRGSTPSLSINFEKGLPPATEAAAQPVADPESVATEHPALPPAKPKTDPSVQAPAGSVETYPAAADARLSAAGAAGDFLVQVYSLDTQEQATAAVADLKRTNYSAFSSAQWDANRRRWYVVYAGPFSSLESANAAAASIRQGYLVRPLIVRRSSMSFDPLPGRALAKRS